MAGENQTMPGFAPIAALLLTMTDPATSPRFEVTIAPGLLAKPEDGRLFVILDRDANGEPRQKVGQTGMDAVPTFARDVAGFGAGSVGVIDGNSAAFPVDSLAKLPPGDYRAQAVFDFNRDLRSINAPGNLYSAIAGIRIDPGAGGTIRFQLSGAIPAESLPPDSELVKYLKIPSKLLSDFHGRPMFLRAGVILPKGFDREPDRKYPLRVHIGGYGARFTNVGRMMADGSPFRSAWMADGSPRMILVHLDGAGPLGDPYQVNSANHGPYGDAVVRELIPAIEARFRGIGDGSARVVDGGSTGGWVSLALQVFYPDEFAGCWSYCPDGVDFRSFQLINIYEDRNAYVNSHGFERPGARDEDGDVTYTMRHELSLENVLGRGDSWALSGGQWGAWNATYGPKAADGRPVPLWDPKTGAIDRSAVGQWKKYDLRLVLERDWARLGPKLRGKIHIWVGEADDYFLNNAVHRLDRRVPVAGRSPLRRVDRLQIGCRSLLDGAVGT